MAVAQGATKPIAEQPALVTPVERATRQPIGRLLILPALVYAIVVTQVPFILTVLYSFQRWNLNRPENRGWVGLNNYVYMFTKDPDFFDSLVTTVIFVIGSVGGSLVFGLLFAELVNHRFPGRGVVRTLLITPFLIMPAVAALTWKNEMLHPTFGVVDWLTRTVLPWHPSPNWIGEYPRVAVIAVLVWRWAPFMMLILLAGMQSISEEVREAARVDGATGWQEFRDITVPHLSRFMQLGALLGTVFIIQEIDPIVIMTQGGPGDATTTLPFLVYEKTRQAFNIGLGAALGVIVVILSIVVITLMLRSLNQLMEGT